MKLYEITGDIREIENLPESEITEEQKKEIMAVITKELENKSEGIIAYIRNEKLAINAIKEEETRLASNRKVKENKLKRFEDYVKSCLINANLDKVETKLGNIGLRKAPVSVEIDENATIAKTYLIPQPPKVDKKAIKDALQQGKKVRGARLITDKVNLNIK